MKKAIILFLIIFGGLVRPLSATEVHHPALWPKVNFNLEPDNDEQKAALDDVQKRANKFLKEPSHAIAVLGSAGKTDPEDQGLLASRKALQDADRAAILALAFRLSQDPRYLIKARNLLVDWATVNQPTGNPIDETRLAGMLWAYDLIYSSLSTDDRTTIETWFEQLRTKKMAWNFGPATRLNNHRTHQLKMLLLLDKVLGWSDEWDTDVDSAEKFCKVNLDKKTGESIDYKQRHALYYHNYDLQAWLEIGLVSGCCQGALHSAFDFLAERIRSQTTGGEFLESSAPIDELRGKNGFSYAQKGGVFDLHRAAPTIIAYYTLMPVQPPDDLWGLAHRGKPSPWLAFLKARYVLLSGKNVGS